MNTHYVKYLGSDLEMVIEIEKDLAVRSSANEKYVLETYSVENFDLQNFIEPNIPCLVFVDFTETNKGYQFFWNKLSQAKQYSKYHSIPVVGIFKDKEQLSKLEMCLNYGVNYAYIKGNEMSIAINDVFYFAFGEYSRKQTFAKVNFKPLPYTGKALALLTKINEEEVEFVSDIELSSEATLVNLPMEQSPQNLSIIEKKECPVTADAMYSYRAKFNYPGPWDEIKEGIVQMDTVMTYIENHKVNFTKEKLSVYIVSNYRNVIFQLLKNDTKYNFNTVLDHKFNLNKVKAGRPSVICLNCQNDDEDEQLMAEFFAQIKDIEDYNPVVVMFNNQKSPEDIKALYSYDLVLSYPSAMDFETMIKLLEVFMKKTQLRTPADYSGFYKSYDPDRKVDILVPMEVTSLTEHEITFYSQMELPMFTTLKLDVPVEAKIIIVPTTTKLYNSEQRGTHYMGFIHGVTLKESNELRKFVNYAISNPLKTFSSDDYNKIKQKLEEKIIAQVEEIAQEAVKEKEEVSMAVERKYKGKTKL